MVKKVCQGTVTDLGKSFPDNELADERETSSGLVQERRGSKRPSSKLQHLASGNANENTKTSSGNENLQDLLR